MDILAMSAIFAADAVLAVILILLMANMDAYFTTIPQSTTKFVDIGGTLKKIMPNVNGYLLSRERDVDGNQWLITATSKTEETAGLICDAPLGTRLIQKILWEHLGVRFIGITWPHARIHPFHIPGNADMEERKEKGSIADLASRIISSKNDAGRNTLPFIITRSMYFEGLDLPGDNAKINILALAVFQQVIPSVPVYNLNTNFLPLLDAAIEAGLIDFLAQHRVKTDAEGAGTELTYRTWLQLAKAGEEGPIESHLRRMNASSRYVRRLKHIGANRLASFLTSNLLDEESHNHAVEAITKSTPHGLIPRCGYALIGFHIVNWSTHSSTEGLAAALLEKETQQHAAEGVRARAAGERDALLAQTTAEEERFKKLVASLTGNGVSPDTAARVVETVLRAEHMGKAGFGTFVEGGTNARVLVPTDHT